MSDALIRLRELTVLLDAAARAYYQEDREIMSDREYDALYDELVRLETETGVRLAISPTQKVGYEVVGSLTKAPHLAPMLSLDKTKDVDALTTFLADANQPGLLAWKLDGLAIVLRYEAGMLTQALTRGNGQVGEDVTHNARVFVNLPLAVPFTHSFTLRGEAVITFADFERINADEEIKFKNPRNLCSGAVRQLNNEIAAQRRVHFYAIGMIHGGPDVALKSEQLTWLASLGFDLVETVQVTADTVSNTVEDFKSRVASIPIASDGLVLTYDNIAFSEALGATAKFPRDAIAFKWADEICETRLLHVEWNTSRTGLINPVAVFEPVEIEGSVVSRASLHNVSVLKSLKLGEGDHITVYKANMIIPQIAENLTCSDNIQLPSHCPVCGEDTQIKAANGVETLTCINRNCEAQTVQALVHFVSRDGMNIEGLSEQTIEKFCAQGLITDYTDIFQLHHHEKEIIEMEGFGQKSFDKLLSAIERAKDVSLAHFICALGIADVGLSNAKLLCTRFNDDFEAIINEAAKPVPVVFEDVKGIGEVTADNLRAYFASAAVTPLKMELLQEHFGHNMEAIMEAARYTPADKPFGDISGFGAEIINNLRSYFTNPENLVRIRKVMPLLSMQKSVPVANTEQALTGLTFVITGDLQHFENRKALQGWIEQRGGKVAGSVSNKTTALINNDATSASSKNKKAAELGVPVVTENAFLASYGGMM